MKVCVFGLWHLGTVTAACLAKAGHDVTGLDERAETVRGLERGEPPLFEPGLEDLVKKGLAQGTLRFTTDVVQALKDAAVVWVAFDTPVDDDDLADVAYVEDHVRGVFQQFRPDTLVLISSQLPVGSTRRIEDAFERTRPGKTVSFAYSPENLRLGKAIAAFLDPDRVVVGVRRATDRKKVMDLLSPITQRIEWMSVESAEMTKHAINAFLAASVTFMNELSTLCERVGADAKEVERGLKSEARIGSKAYLGPGGAIAGGTLIRDLGYLLAVGERTGVATPFIGGVKASNDAHKAWAGRKVMERLKDLNGRKVGVLGLTYKPGTDTLRRSSSIEVCLWLAKEGARVWAHNPRVKVLPEDLTEKIRLASSPEEVLQDSEALVVATEWPDYKSLNADQIVRSMKTPFVVDANRFLYAALGTDSRVSYDAVGMP